MAANTSAAPTVAQIGASFVHQYYLALTKEPSKLYKFYKNESRFTHGNEGESNVESVVGQEAIKRKIEAINFSDCKAKLSTVDSQQSQNGSILVVVNGFLSNKGSVPRKFTQTFFLAPQAKGYYVLNDVFRYLDTEGLNQDRQVASENETVTAAPAPQEEKVAPAPAPAPVAEKPGEKPAAAPVQAPATTEKPAAAEKPAEKTAEKQAEKPAEKPATTPAAPAAAEKPAQKPKSAWAKPEKAEEPAEEKAAAAAPAAKPAPQPQQQKPKPKPKPQGPPSYASILAGPNYEPAEVPIGTPAPEEKPKKERKPKDQQGPRKEKPQGEAGAAKGERKDGEKKERRAAIHEVYISNVPSTATQDDLRTLFSQCGKVIHVNTKFVPEKNYAFVVFDSRAGVEAAIAQDNKLTLHGKNIRVEERRPLNQGPRQAGERRDNDRRRGSGERRDRKPAAQGQQQEGAAAPTAEGEKKPRENRRNGEERPPRSADANGASRGGRSGRGGRGGRGGFRSGSPKEANGQQQQVAKPQTAPAAAQ
eukprot:GEZU01029323.1.p1 GENE.GEZU01029323.1~~GEZU01029323.1.p1  ORF type:complete len:543 (+),score=214.28 GEZU01029323.1:35-1630(+)